MSDIRRAITSLGSIEERLRRSLNLAGEVGATFSPAAIPVVLAADATVPGASSAERGRRFAAACSALLAANPGTAAIEARASVVITRLSVLGTTAIGTSVTVRHIVPGTAADFACTATGGGLTSWCNGWVERPASNDDFGPIFGGYNAATFTTGRAVAVFPPQGTVYVDVLREPFFLEGPRSGSSTGARLSFTTSAAVANSYLIVEGYTF